MAGAYRDALLGQQMRQIRVMHTLDGKTGQCQLRLAQQANAVACRQTFEQIVVQCGFVIVHGVLIETGEIVQRCSKTNDTGDWRCSRLETQRCRAKACVVVIGVQHHFTAELPRPQLLQRVVAPEQYAQPIGAVEFVAGKYIKVATQSLYVMAAMDHALRAVNHGQSVVRLGHRQQRGQRLPGANHVGQLADSQQARARADQTCSNFKVDHAVGIQWQDHQLQVATVRQLLPWQQVGVMLQGADDNLIARVE
ncbi:hypothetical protein D3C85_1123150 [compost metagenome]